jgi:regulatory protein
MKSRLSSESAGYTKALNYSFLRLRYRSRSKNEIISRLDGRRYDGKTIRKVVSYLVQYNYINDKEFSRAFIEAGIQRGWGPRKIDFNLAKLGVAARLRTELLSRNVDYSCQIKHLIEKRDRSLGPVKDRAAARKKAQKILRYLLGRGFRYQDVIREMEDRITNF